MGVTRILWLGGGLVSVGLGWLGLVVPGLPGTVFFIIAAWCFSHSSERLENWVLNLPRVGPMVADYRAGLGMPRRAKVLAISCIVIATSLSVIFALEHPLARLALIAVAVLGVWWVGWRTPTREAVQTVAP